MPGDTSRSVSSRSRGSRGGRSESSRTPRTMSRTASRTSRTTSSRGSSRRTSSRAEQQQAALSAATSEDDKHHVWEEEHVTRMLELGDDDGEADGSSEARATAEDAVEGDAEDEQAQRDSSSSERCSDITDPFEELHFRGALQTEADAPAPTQQQQTPGSRRTQFLRDVSLFSPEHQLAMLEVREKQGVSLLERSTSLTAEPLELVLLALHQSLAADAAADHVDASPAGSRGVSPNLAVVGPGGGSSGEGSRGSRSRGGSPCSSRHSRHSRHAPSERSDRSDKSSRKARRRAKEEAEEEKKKPVKFVTRRPSSLERSNQVDRSLGALLRELWGESGAGGAGDGGEGDDAGGGGAERAERRKSLLRPGRRGQGAEDRAEDNYPDVLSSLWRMLDGYEEFVCSPPGFHAFRQDKPHWLDQQPTPWAVREAAREKCMRWLDACPAIPAQA